VKELLKSDSICQSYAQMKKGPVFSTRSVYAELCFGRVLKRSLSAHLMQVKLILFTFYLNGGLHTVSIGKPSERMSNFWTVRFLKTEYEQNSGFPHIPKTALLDKVLAYQSEPPDAVA